jgi:hypothetical protein
VSEYNTDIKGSFQGALGDHSHAHHLDYIEIGKQIEESTNLTALVTELETLRQALKKEATTEDQDKAVSDIGQAKKAIEAKETSKAVSLLKSAGTWALDVGTRIGVPVAVEAIKQAVK